MPSAAVSAGSASAAGPPRTGAASKRDELADVEPLVGRLEPDRLVHRRLEPAQIDHQVSIGHIGDLARAELQIVRLGARLHQVLHA